MNSNQTLWVSSVSQLRESSNYKIEVNEVMINDSMIDLSS